MRVRRLFCIVTVTVTVSIGAIEVSAEKIAVTLDETGGTAGSNGFEFSEGYRFNVNAAITVTELGKFDVVGDGLEEDAIVALFNWDTGVKIVEATILAGTPTEETGSFDTHFVDIPDLVLAPGTDYLVAVEVGPFDATYDATGTFISTFKPVINRIEGRFTDPFGDPSMPATAAGFTGSFPGDSYYGPNFKFVPEPSSIILLGLGLLAFVGHGRRYK